MWQHLKNKIVSILEANTLIGAVFNYENAEFGQDPVVTVTASSNESDYRTTSENRRIYAFLVQVWVERTSPRDDKEAEEVLTDVVDQVLIDFDRYFDLPASAPGGTLTLPTGMTFVRLEATPSVWFYAKRPKDYRVAEINIKCHIDADVFSIS